MRDLIPLSGIRSRIEPKNSFVSSVYPGRKPWAALTRAFGPKSKPVSMATAFG